MATMLDVMKPHNPTDKGNIMGNTETDQDVLDKLIAMNKRMRSPSARPRPPIMKMKSWFQGPRWWNITHFIKAGCLELGIECSIISVEKHWLRQTVWFELTGERDKLEMFKRAMSSSVEEYNSD